MPNELSGGQQQRVAVARAIATSPALLLADEPTGNLDSTSTAEVLDVFKAMNDQGRTVVMITHEDEVAERAHRVIRLRDGEVIEDRRVQAIVARCSPDSARNPAHDPIQGPLEGSVQNSLQDSRQSAGQSPTVSPSLGRRRASHEYR